MIGIIVAEALGIDSGNDQRADGTEIMFRQSRRSIVDNRLQLFLLNVPFLTSAFLKSSENFVLARRGCLYVDVFVGRLTCIGQRLGGGFTNAS